MKRQYLGAGGITVLVLVVFGVSARAEENVEVLCTSPSGAHREPVAPVADEAALKKRFEALDGQLNRKYSELLGGIEKDRVGLMREGQRKWLKKRDAGEKFYLEQFSSAEKIARRFQFLGDVTAARIELPPDEWEL